MANKYVCPLGFVAIVIIAVSAAAPDAAATSACVNGRSIKGSYVITLQGQIITGGNEALAGVMQSAGDCTLTANLYGNINGVSEVRVPATGTYMISDQRTGTLTLTIGQYPTQTFTINRLQRHNQVVGLESDGVANVNLLIRLQQASNFSQFTLRNSYSYLCSLANNQTVSILSMVYNGTGSGAYSGFAYGSGDNLQNLSGQATYLVNSDGTYTGTIVDSLGNRTLFGGGIESSGANVPFAVIAYNGSGIITGPARCLGQQQ